MTYWTLPLPLEVLLKSPDFWRVQTFVNYWKSRQVRQSSVCDGFAVSNVQGLQLSKSGQVRQSSVCDILADTKVQA